MIYLDSRNRVLLFLFMAFSTIAILYWFMLDDYQDVENRSISIATGTDGGMYARFGQSIEQQSKLDINLRPSAGSVENVKLLKDGMVDYAIVQNDIAQYSYFGIRDQEKFSNLNYLLPLFPEYVQVIVPEKSDVEVLTDLRGRRICVGAAGSGTYFNSLDVLAEAGLRETFDYTPVIESSENCIESIDSGGEIDAILSTSNRKITESEKGFRQLYFSDSIAQSLASKYPYFRFELVERADGTTESQLVVDAYLATNSSQSPAAVEALLTELVTNWEQYRAKSPSVPALNTESMDAAIPFHSAVDSTLVNMGVRQFNYWFWIGVFALAALFILSLVAERKKTAYNRLGQSSLSKASNFFFLKAIGKVSQTYIGIVFVISFIALSVYFLRETEDFFAQKNGIVSPFARMTFADNLVWLFTYITSGFTSDDIYPVSFLGKLIAATLAIIGVVGPITVLFYVINLANQQHQRKLQGHAQLDLKNHVLICGWNEKVPGIVYTLTGTEVGRRKKIVVVADLEGDYPLSSYNFDHSLVHYCKGTPSDNKTLERACISEAQSVLIMADFGDGTANNNNSILTAMNVRKANTTCHISAEIEYLDNLDHFYASGCDSLIHPSRLARRMVIASILDERILDYVFDMVTYHAFDELHSVSAAKIVESRGWQDITVGEVEQELFDSGINLVGISADKGRAASAKSIDRGEVGFNIDERSRAFLDSSDGLRVLRQNDVIIYSAQNAKDIYRLTRKYNAEPLHDRQFEISYPTQCKVLVFGGKFAIENIERQLRAIIENLEFTGVDTTKNRIRSIDDIKKRVTGSYDKIVVLTPHDTRTEFCSFDEINANDTELILLAQLLRQVFPSPGGELADGKIGGNQLICEIGNIENRELLVSSGVDIVLPTILMAERFFSKEVYDKNYVIDFLMAAMNLKDGIHLHSHTISKNDGFCGESYAQILRTPIDGSRILGWLPLSQRSALTNKEGDFGFHFRTAIDSRIVAKKAAVGDILIMLIQKRTIYASGG